MDLGAWGIDEGYHDVTGAWHETPPETREAFLRAMGAGEGPPGGPPDGPPLWFVGAGEAPPLRDPAELALEDGTVLRAEHALPPDLPAGYHDLHPLDGGPTTRLFVTPRRCHLPADLRTWGWAVQLYAARSRESWGIGDLADLRRLSRWAADQGAGVIALNPLHTATPALPQQPSPYYPSSRRFRSPLYLRVEEVPGAAGAGADLEAAARAGRALNERRHIDRDEVFRLKIEALGRLWGRFGDDADFDRFRADQGTALERFGVFSVLAERHGPGWPAWPEELRRRQAPAVARVAEEEGDRVRFHAWLQWLLDRQLREAGPVPLLQDLAVGFDPGGADAWDWQDLLALDARVGAPPDEFNTRGQDWGLPPFVPWKLRAARYDPFVQTLRFAFAHACAIRVDHVMGLFRLFWLPAGASPTEGAYVRSRASELLDILAIESQRAGAFVVGEDLGTVEPGVREDLAERDVLSYRLLWFEDTPPEGFPAEALAAVTTHDLPTVAGMWTGADLEAQRRIGLAPNEEGEAKVRARLRSVAGVADGAEPEAVVAATYRALGRAPSRVLLATLDDALAVEERPNMPGTVDEWPNWSIALPVPVEELEGRREAAVIAEALAARAAGTGPGSGAPAGAAGAPAGAGGAGAPGGPGGGGEPAG